MITPHDRADRAFNDLLGESLDKAIAAETKELRIRLIEVEAEHAATTMRLANHHKARQIKDGRLMCWMVALSWLAGTVTGWMWSGL